MESYRGSHKNKGHDYDMMFYDNPYRKMIWRIEKSILTSTLNKHLSNTKKIDYLDFACGTGRVLEHMESVVDNANGIDVSSAMLEIARKKATKATVIEGDLTLENIFDNNSFDVITAFRFFPNAEPALRNEALNALKNLLRTDGILIFNNHRNLSSLTNRFARLLKRGGNEGMTENDTQTMLHENNLIVVDVYHIGVLPSTENHMLFPSKLFYLIEKIASKIGILSSVSQHLIYVCKINRS